ncbi:MAG: 5-formyltetrahydrofolate cyclo-ligase, partial [Thiothrix sp.]
MTKVAPTASPHLPSETTLRRQLRRQRAALPPPVQQQYATQALRHLRQQATWRNARHIALYLPVQGEMDPTLLRKLALPRQTFYLPVLSPFHDKRLWFVRWDKQTRLRLNRFKIPEPVASYRQARSARCLDLVITPLVAFDLRGNRLGMGGGFYDRSLAYLRRRKNWHKPTLLGVAHRCQH